MGSAFAVLPFALNKKVIRRKKSFHLKWPITSYQHKLSVVFMLARTIEALLGITLAANIFRFVSKRQLELVAYVMMAFNRLQSLL